MQVGFSEEIAPVTRDASSRDATLVRIERVDLARFEEIRRLNKRVFGDTRVLFSLDHEDLTLLLASDGAVPIGFKVGYAENGNVFYSAKGGVLESYRRNGVAKALLTRLMEEARRMGYRRFAFDTFPNRHPGMTVLALNEGFGITAAGYNAAYKDYRLRFETRL